MVIIGAGGHVGLPLSLVLADAGFDVVGVDENARVNESLSRGELPYVEEDAAELLRRGLDRGALRFTTSVEDIASADTIVVVIGTPIDENLNPRIDPLLSIFEKNAARLRRGQLVVLRSTVSPGTTELVKAMIERTTGLREGDDFQLVFAPERVLQTRAVQEIRHLPQLIGAFSEAGFERARAFFARFVENRCLRLSPVEAELGKLITNMSRYVSFALANEFHMICDAHGANSHRVIRACGVDYPRFTLPRPGANVGGPCLYKDGYFLTDRIPYAELIANAFKVNESIPGYLVEAVRRRTPLRRAGILGMTFKADCDDTRNSLSFRLQKKLRGIDCEPVPVDPFLPDFADASRLRGVDALFLMTPHTAFARLDRILAHVGNRACVIADMWDHWPVGEALSHNGIYTAGEAQDALAREAMPRAAAV